MIEKQRDLNGNNSLENEDERMENEFCRIVIWNGRREWVGYFEIYKKKKNLTKETNIYEFITRDSKHQFVKNSCTRVFTRTSSSDSAGVSDEYRFTSVEKITRILNTH